MNTNGITATLQSRFGRITAGLVALLTAMLMLAAVQANSASAADTVGNPGAFTATFNSGTMQYGNRTFTPSGSFDINVNPDGTFTAGAITFPGASAPNIVVNSNVEFREVTLTPQTTNTWGGTIDPQAGTLSLSGGLEIGMYSNRSGYFNGIFGSTNTSTTTCVGSTGVNVNLTGSNYDFGAGTVALGYSPFQGGGASGCNARSNLVGGSTSNYDGNVNSAYGMNGSSNSISWSLTIKNGAGEPVKPWPVRATFTVSPDPVGVGEVASFDASASGIDDGVQACGNPDPSEANCGYRWDFDGDGTVDAVTNGPNVTHSYSTAGNYSPTLTIFDVNGKSDTHTGSIWVQAKPEAQIDTHPPAITNQTANEFTFSIPVNPYSATTECSVDGGAWGSCTSPATFNFTQADDTTGTHNFRVRGVTPGGVVGPTDQYDFTIDRVWPVVTIDPNSMPADPTNVTSANFAFGADKSGTSFECQLDGGSWDACGTNSSGTKAYSGLAETPNPHVFTVRGTDPYGNVGEASYSWEVDVTAPVLSWTTTPAQPSNDTDPVFEWSSDEPIQLAQCRLAIGGVQAAWTNCGSLTTKSFSNLADDSYVFAVRALDLAGNWSSVLSWDWRVETVPPALAFDSTPAAKTNQTSAQFRFSHPVDSTTTCTLDGGAVQDPCPSGVKYDYLPAGTHTFTVTATDPALNPTTISWTWDIKTSQPAVTIDQNSVPAIDLGNGNIPVTDSADATFELNTANGDAECRLDSAAWAACDSNTDQAYTGLTDGYHLFEARAVDEYGNASLIDAYAWLVLADAPTVTFTSTPAANTNQGTALIGFSVATADNNVTVTCALDGVALDGLGSADCGSPAALTQLTDGSHTFEVTATDSAGQSVTESHTWNVKVTGPGVDITATPDAISNSNAAAFEFESDDAGATLECRLDGQPWAACTSPHTLTGVSNGQHTFAVRATDSVGNSTVASYTWRVDTVVPTVSITDAPSGTTDEVAALIKFNGSEGGLAFECQVDGGAWGACTSPLLVRQLAVGAHTVKVRASDDAGNTSAEAAATWTVDAPPAPVPPNSGRPAPAAPPAQAGDGEPTGLSAPATSPKQNANAKKIKQLRQKAKRLTRKAKALRKAGKTKRANKVQKRAKKARQQARKLAGAGA